MKWRVTCIDTTSGEIYSCDVDYHGFPSHLCDPLYECDRGGTYRTGLILRVEKVLYDI